MVKKVAGNDRESGWNLEWEEEKRRRRKRGEKEEEEGGYFGGMRLNQLWTNCVTQMGLWDGCQQLTCSSSGVRWQDEWVMGE